MPGMVSPREKSKKIKPNSPLRVFVTESSRTLTAPAVKIAILGGIWSGDFNVPARDLKVPTGAEHVPAGAERGPSLFPHAPSGDV